MTYRCTCVCKCVLYHICMFVDHLTTDGIMLHVSNDKPLLGEEITVTAFLSDNDKVCMYTYTRVFIIIVD